MSKRGKAYVTFLLIREDKNENLVISMKKVMKRSLMIDRDDPRRATRVLLLRNTGYEVVTANRFEDVEGLVREAGFDLIVVEPKDVRKASIA